MVADRDPGAGAVKIADMTDAAILRKLDEAVQLLDVWTRAASLRGMAVQIDVMQALTDDPAYRGRGYPKVILQSP
jgi:hypothetical protein